MTTGDRIKARRKQLAISADELADRIGVSRSTVFRWEKGDIEKLPAIELNDIALTLQTTVEYLIGCTDDPEIHNVTDETVLKKIPKTKQARILAGIADIMPENERDFLLGMVEHMYEKYAAEYERMEKKHEGSEP